MSSQFFGQFLLQNSVINAAQLKAAVVVMDESVNSRLEILATEAGFISSRDAEAIRKRVRSGSPGVAALTFGDAALEQGVLNHEQLRLLMAGQMDESVILGEALLNADVIGPETLSAQLEKFNADVYASPEDLAKLFEGRRNADVLEVMTGHFTELSLQLLQMLFKAERFHEDVDEVNPCEYSLYQDFHGDWSGRLQVNLSSALVLRMGSKLAGEQTLVINETSLDGAREFLSLLSGGICARLSRMGRKLDVGAPHYQVHAQVGERSGKPAGIIGSLGDGTLTLVPFAHPSETVELCIVDRS